MTPEQKSELEAMVEAKLPPWYLEFLRHYPPTLQRARRALDDSDAEGYVKDVELCEDPVDVVFLNLEARVDCLPTPDNAEFFWPPQLLVIGETGFGDYYCIDALEEVSGVIQFNHQEVAFEQITDDLQEFVEILEDTFASNHSDTET